MENTMEHTFKVYEDRIYLVSIIRDAIGRVIYIDENDVTEKVTEAFNKTIN